MIHLPFCQSDEAAAGEGHRKVAQRRDGKARKALEGQSDDVVRAEHQVGKTDDRNDGRLLDDRDELVAKRGENVLDRLRQHDEAHSLAVAEADAARGLHLPDVHGLHAGTNDLGDVGAAVDAHGDNAGGKTRKVRDPRNVRQREADHGKSVENKHELHHQGRPADELDVSDRQPLERQNFAHAHTGHERAEDRAEKHGECGDDERIDNAFLKKAVVTDDELADRLNKFHGDSSSVHSGLRRRNGEARRLLFMFFSAYRPRLAASSTASS